MRYVLNIGGCYFYEALYFDKDKNNEGSLKKSLKLFG
jgi:hypothetical protein